MSDAIEVMLLRWTDSHNGRTVTFLLPDDGGPNPFKGLKCGPASGQRMAISVALIGDDETISSAGLGNTGAPAQPAPTEGKGNPAQEPQPPTDTGRPHRDYPQSRPGGVMGVCEAYGGKRCVGTCKAPRDCSATPRRVRTEAQRAGRLCNSKSFQQFLANQFPRDFPTAPTAQEAAEFVRAYCGVASRSEIDDTPEALASWHTLTAEYDFAQRGQPF